jgi:A/G-specific adenine glycosylase
VKKLLGWFGANARDLPWRRTFDPYAIWVSEIMLQQTQVSTVTPYWERWMHELPDIQSLACASEQKVLKLWEGLGYYTRARNLHRAAKSLNGQPFPREYQEVLKLPGIGRYTAGAICSIAFNQPTPVLDGNVRRVLSRMFATNDNLWAIAEQLVNSAARTNAESGRGLPQSKTLREFRQVLECGSPLPLSNTLRLSGPCGVLNEALMELGAVICTPRGPRCGECPVRAMCQARKLGRVEKFPAKPARATVTHRRFAAFVYQHKGRYLVRQRPDNVVNARLWEFPNVEMVNGACFVGHPLCAFKHTITRYRIAVEAYLIHKKPMTTGKWLPLAGLEKLPFSSAHRKILVALRTQNAV